MSYWERRQKLLNSALEKDEAALREHLAAYYETEYAALDKEIAAYYSKYGVNNVIEYRTLLDTLSEQDVELLIKKTDEFVSKYPDYSHLVPVRNSIYKLNRLEGLQYSVRLQQAEIGAVTTEDIRKHLMSQALRGSKAAAEAMGFGKNFYNERMDIISKFVDRQWSNEKSFSDRIWENTEKLADTLNYEIASGFARGTSYADLTNLLHNKFVNTSKNDAYRLIYTEGTYVMAESSITPFEEDFEEYAISIVHDGKACSICTELSQHTFRIKDRVPGINFPPLHPWCRCTFEIVVEDWDKWIDNYTKTHTQQQAEILKHRLTSDEILTDSEKYAINQYISSKSYTINGKLRDGISLTDEEKELIINFDKALEKMPVFEGTLTRSLYFNDENAITDFLSKHKPGSVVEYEQYISTTFGDEYNPDGQVLIIIKNSRTGKNISKYNNSESEVIFKRHSRFSVVNVVKASNKIFIHMMEA